MSEQTYDPQEVLDDLLKQLKLHVNAAQGLQPSESELRIISYIECQMGIPRDEWWKPGDPDGYERD